MRKKNKRPTVNNFLGWQLFFGILGCKCCFGIAWFGKLCQQEITEAVIDTTVVYTDGACIKNPGPGGWAWVISETENSYGSEPHTTNQRMELSAVINAVQDIDTPLHIVSDSAYVVNCFEQRWWVKWRSNRWRNAKGDLVANQDLWEVLIGHVVDMRPGEITFQWVKGHAGEHLNEMADMLANQAARGQLNAR